MARPVLQISVSDEVLRALREQAKLEGVSVGDLCRRFIAEGLERRPRPEDDSPFGSSREAGSSSINF